jgi:hypothetical protein
MFMEMNYERDLRYGKAGIIVIDAALVNAVAVIEQPPL